MSRDDAVRFAALASELLIGLLALTLQKAIDDEGLLVALLRKRRVRFRALDDAQVVRLDTLLREEPIRRRSNLAQAASPGGVRSSNLCIGTGSLPFEGRVRLASSTLYLDVRLVLGRPSLLRDFFVRLRSFPAKALIGVGTLAVERREGVKGHE